jgi:hypothetical protein
MSLFLEYLHDVVTYISTSTAPACTTITITLKLYALNIEFQHFILRFNKNSLLLWISLKEGIGGERKHLFPFFLNASTTTTYIFNTLTCTTTYYF